MCSTSRNITIFFTGANIASSENSKGETEVFHVTIFAMRMALNIQRLKTPLPPKKTKNYKKQKQKQAMKERKRKQNKTKKETNKQKTFIAMSLTGTL